MFEPRADGTMSLSDRRTVGIAEWGAADGPPVLHGGPHSRLWCPDLAAAQAVGCRLITIDRPGYGRSVAPREIDIAAWTHDVRQIVDALGIDRFSVVGWSAGGLYAAACAAVMPERLVSAGAVAGAITVPGEDGGYTYDSVSDQSRQVIAEAARDPQAARALAADFDTDWVAEHQDDPALIHGRVPGPTP
jgi:pimeloyl-ACP methyl ester carboxylesterase